MTIRVLTISSAFLIATSLPMLARQNNMTVSDEAKGTIDELHGHAVVVANEADLLRITISNPESDPVSHILHLDAIKDEINAMGKEMETLENEHASLTDWEQHAVDKVLPLLKEMAENTTQAIQYCNDNRTHLWTPVYRDMAGKILTDSDQLSRTLKDYLNYAKATNQEHRLSHTLGGE